MLALASVAHLIGAVVRKYRAGHVSVASPLVLPSVALAAAPWIWSTPVALGGGFVAHLVWLILCEALASPVRTLSHSATKRPRGAAGQERRQEPKPAPSRASTPDALVKSASGGGFTSLGVLALLDEALDIRTIRLERPLDFDFQPGQFVAVRVQVDGRPHVRCYSISSSPDASGYLEISVRRQGLVSTMLHATVRAGSKLSISRPGGRFVYPAGDDRPLVLLAGGIGITPLLSMLRYSVAAQPTRPVTLLYSARDRHTLAFLHELQVISERHPQVRVGITLSHDDGAGSRWRHGRIDQALLRQYVTHPAHTVFCLCGPDAMMHAMEALLREEGVQAEQIRSEQFSTAVVADVLNTAIATVASERPALASGREVRVTFESTGRETSVQSTETLLEVAEREGVSIASSCRAGVCQACRTRLIDGDADCQSSVLDASERAQGFVLPCVTYPTSDCVLEA